ncbi:phage head morphogenesis protein [Rhodovarius crocodyli]|uniref:Phage head morphogenesis protein n=1 Tax=Rhodovarius crocodyli TaxID=1979269 RepID=A0A437MC76_9PROT|nr:phage minor head protein [Rhodovarius crocodyli]RVT95242.1 phage head morphogenesis protein [Rhodovarius crocodyli]
MALNRLLPRKPRDVVLPAVRPNAGLTVAFRKKLDALVAQMHADIVRKVTAAWKAKTPRLAQDDDGPQGKSAAMYLRDEMKRLGRRWESRFDTAAPELAAWFSKSAFERSDAAMRRILDDAGFSVRFSLSPTANDVLQATIGEQIDLISNLAAEHVTQVQGAVMRSVQSGRDLGALTKDLEARLGITRRRAALIARDQNSKATATITRVRQQELGITEAIWQHSHGGKHPRPSHLAADGEKYDIAKGMYLDGVWTWPGREVNCRCVSRSVIPGFD